MRKLAVLKFYLIVCLFIFFQKVEACEHCDSIANLNTS